MREIKFRAWDNEDKKMYKVVRIAKSIYGYCECDNLLVCNLEADEHLKETDIRYSYDYELMQYVGIKDKEGKEIYEGDIDQYGNVVTYVADVNESLGMNCGWYLQRDNFESWSELVCGNNYIEIKGNIYENPELLRR